MVNMKKIILNQKSYLMYDEIVKFKHDFEKIKAKNYEFILFPPIHYLSMFNKCDYLVGTQNFYSYKNGSFTGEVNLESLKDMNINYTLVGHFERRIFIGESYETAKEKLFKSLNSKCNTILCVGEIRKTRKPFSYIKKEISYYLRSIESSTLKYLSIAYIPSRATLNADKSVDEVELIINKIKKYMYSKYKLELEVFYGGNIEKSNFKDIYDICDGVILDKNGTDINILKELLSEIE